MPMTRSRRNAEANSEAKRAVPVRNVHKSPVRAVAKPGSSRVDMTAKVSQRDEKLADEYPVYSVKNKEQPPKHTNSSRHKSAIEVSQYKNPREFDGIYTESRHHPMEGRKFVFAKKPSSKKPPNLASELKVVGKFFKDALSKQQEFHSIFKDYQDDFDKKIEAVKNKQKSGIPGVPFHQTPLGKQVYSNLRPPSPLRVNNKACNSRGNVPTASVIPESSKYPKLPVIQKGSLAELNEESENSFVDQEGDNPELSDKTVPAMDGNSQNSKAVISEKGKVDDGVDAIVQAIDKLSLRPIVMLSRMSPNKTIGNSQKRKRSSEQYGSVIRALDEIPLSFEFELRGPETKKLNMSIVETAPPFVIPIINGTYFLDKERRKDEKNRESQQSKKSSTNGTYFLDKERRKVDEKNRESELSKKSEQSKKSITNEKYILDKERRKDDEKIRESEQSKKSEELFEDETVSIFEESGISSLPTQLSPELIPDSVSKLSYCSSTASSSTDCFDLTVMKKSIPRLVPFASTFETDDDVSGNQDLKSVEKELTTHSQISNTTIVLDDDDTLFEKKTLGTAVMAELNETYVKTFDSQKPTFSGTTFTKVVTNVPVNDQTFDVCSDRLSEMNEEDSQNDVKGTDSSVANKTNVKVSQEKKLVKMGSSNSLKEGALSSKGIKTVRPTKYYFSNSSKSSSSSSGSMKSALSQPSLSITPPSEKMGLKNTVTYGSSGTLFDRQMPVVENKESALKKRLKEKEEEATKRKLESDQKKIELQKKKNEEWKKKADKIRAEEKKQMPMMPTKLIPGQGVIWSSSTKVQSPIPMNIFKYGKPLNLLKPPSSIYNFASKFNLNKALVSHTDPFANMEAADPEDSFRSATDVSTIFDATADVDPANTYDITLYEDIDAECKHRRDKPIPDWAKGENIPQSLFKQILFLGENNTFFLPADANYKLFPNCA